MLRDRLTLVATAATRRDAMSDRAARLWPDSPRNAREWLRAVAVVRSTRSGWLLDPRQPRVSA